MYAYFILFSLAGSLLFLTIMGLYLESIWSAKAAERHRNKL